MVSRMSCLLRVLSRWYKVSQCRGTTHSREGSSVGKQVSDHFEVCPLYPHAFTIGQGNAPKVF